jgi:hypothetical protein
MTLRRISELDQTFKSPSGNVIEWRSPGGWLYRYERERAAVGMESGPGTGEFLWHVLDKNDLTTAKRRVFDLINEDEL